MFVTTILNKLASALNRRDEVPNQALAHEIVRTSDTDAIGTLVENLWNKNKNILFGLMMVDIFYHTSARHIVVS